MDHYYGLIKPRVAAFMDDLEKELWELGIYAKTKHNEVAPAQHELAPHFTSLRLACDHDQLTLEILHSVADRHGLACLTHEKPFKGINGSGKHNNWSIATDTGLNLLDPGDTPHENAQFILFLVAIIKAIDEYQDLLRLSVANASNDHRLGGHEAPPAVISIFLGDELSNILASIETGEIYHAPNAVDTFVKLGKNSLPSFVRGTNDRNRTSPFTFCNNKFEFRMLGSSQSITTPNLILNTIVADALESFADILEKSSDFEQDLVQLIKDTLIKHKRIIYNGDNYQEMWQKEAEKRGLYNFKTTVDVLPRLIDKKNINLFEKHGVSSPEEVHSRFNIYVEQYCKTLHIEALVLVTMCYKYIIPDAFQYQHFLTELLTNKKSLGVDFNVKMSLLNEISDLNRQISMHLINLKTMTDKAEKEDINLELAKFYHYTVFPEMNTLRSYIDRLEMLVAKKYWSLPNYEDLLYSV